MALYSRPVISLISQAEVDDTSSSSTTAAADGIKGAKRALTSKEMTPKRKFPCWPPALDLPRCKCSSQTPFRGLNGCKVCSINAGQFQDYLMHLS
jgi:hypothetical protein